jgi:hypothetical protein
MRKGAFAATLLVAALASAWAENDARACGGCFHSPGQVATVVTDHRMIFRVTPQATTLYDQIEYSGDPADFAWVLPIQGQVTVGLSSDRLFSALDKATQTTILPPAPPTCPFCGCGTGTGGSSGGGFLGGVDAGAGVIVLSQAVVGPYETVQLQSTDPNALTNWLTMHGYSIPADIAPIVAAYVAEGFDFLALRLVPGMGVSAMRPVRVTSPGAGLSLPLRMVAAGTGATVGITLWVIGDGRYEPVNYKSFTIDPSTITWDFTTANSNYAALRSSEEAALNFAAWQIESSTDVAAYTIEGPVLGSLASNDYPVSGAADAGAGASNQARQDDLATLFPGGNQGSVRITRMRADLSHRALATDLVLQASANDSILSNLYQVTKSVNAPTCPVTTCPPCDNGSTTGSITGSTSGFTTGSTSGVTSGATSGVTSGATSGGTSGYSSSGSSGSSNSGGCATQDIKANSGVMDLVLLGLVGTTLVGMRSRRKR